MWAELRSAFVPGMGDPSSGHRRIRDFTGLTARPAGRDNRGGPYMAPDDHSGVRPAGPVVLRIKLRYDDLDAMVETRLLIGESGVVKQFLSIHGTAERAPLVVIAH